MISVSVARRRLRSSSTIGGRRQVDGRLVKPAETSFLKRSERNAIVGHLRQGSVEIRRFEERKGLDVRLQSSPQGRYEGDDQRFSELEGAKQVGDRACLCRSNSAVRLAGAIEVDVGSASKGKKSTCSPVATSTTAESNPLKAIARERGRRKGLPTKVRPEAERVEIDPGPMQLQTRTAGEESAWMGHKAQPICHHGGL